MNITMTRHDNSLLQNACTIVDDNLSRLYCRINIQKDLIVIMFSLNCRVKITVVVTGLDAWKQNYSMVSLLTQILSSDLIVIMLSSNLIEIINNKIELTER